MQEYGITNQNCYIAGNSRKRRIVAEKKSRSWMSVNDIIGRIKLQQKRRKRMKESDVVKSLQQSKHISRLQQQGSSRKRSLIEDKAGWALKKLHVKQPGNKEEETSCRDIWMLS